MTLGSFGMRLLYRCNFNVDVGTSEEQLNRLIEDALKEEAELWEWPDYEWVKHKIERPDRDYYIVEVGEAEPEHRRSEGEEMRRIEDLPEEVYQVFEETFNTYAYLQGNYAEIVLCAEHFFAAGYEAAIAERAKFDEQNNLIVKEIGEL